MCGQKDGALSVHELDPTLPAWASNLLARNDSHQSHQSHGTRHAELLLLCSLCCHFMGTSPRAPSICLGIAHSPSYRQRN